MFLAFVICNLAFSGRSKQRTWIVVVVVAGGGGGFVVVVFVVIVAIVVVVISLWNFRFVYVVLRGVCHSIKALSFI